MTDIVERLRDWVSRPDNSRLQLHAMSLEAADEIERLRAELARARNLADIALERVVEPKARQP
jgi:hypothetical protein